ncbi:MAG: CinA family protein [Pseudomonadota bacterium]|nr:CinA family protein [Pseudomonadota bacterium]
MELAQAVLAAARSRGWTLATAESCTGGLLGAALTEVPGSSDVYERGFITYANQAKQEMLGVVPQLIAAHGAVSSQTAAAMAEGALRASPADLAVSVTGIAGPGGGSPTKPVGLVWLATATRGQTARPVERLYGDLGRSGVREAAVRTALELLLEQLQTGSGAP